MRNLNKNKSKKYKNKALIISVEFLLFCSLFRSNSYATSLDDTNKFSQFNDSKKHNYESIKNLVESIPNKLDDKNATNKSKKDTTIVKENSELNSENQGENGNENIESVDTTTEDIDKLEENGESVQTKAIKDSAMPRPENEGQDIPLATALRASQGTFTPSNPGELDHFDLGNGNYAHWNQEEQTLEISGTGNGPINPYNWSTLVYKMNDSNRVKNEHHLFMGNNNNYTIKFKQGAVIKDGNVISSGSYGLANGFFVGMFSGFDGHLVFEEGIDTSGLTTMKEMFLGVKNDIVGLEHFDTSHVANMERAFQGYGGEKLNIGKWNTEKVTTMSHMFFNAIKAKPDVTNWKVGNVTTFKNMFLYATKAEPDVTNWDTHSATDMFGMFEYALSANPNVSKWDVSNVTNMTRMFQNTTFTSIDLTNWKTSKVTSMRQMFLNSRIEEFKGINDLDVSKVTTFKQMFKNGNFSTLDISSWKIQPSADTTEMFSLNESELDDNVNGAGLNNDNGDAVDKNIVKYPKEKLPLKKIEDIKLPVFGKEIVVDRLKAPITARDKDFNQAIDDDHKGFKGGKTTIPPGKATHIKQTDADKVNMTIQMPDKKSKGLGYKQSNSKGKGKSKGDNKRSKYSSSRRNKL